MAFKKHIKYPPWINCKKNEEILYNGSFILKIKVGLRFSKPYWTSWN